MQAPSSRIILAAAVLLAPALGAAPPPDPLASYAPVVTRLVEAARREGRAWQRLEQLTDTFGHRLAGTPQLEAALRWAADEMRADGLEAVRLEPVTVPHWERGRESLELLAPVRQELVLLGLGNSLGTPPEGIEAGLLVVKSFEELDARASEARGRIVLYDVPYAGYGDTVRYRSQGASRAARHGAVAVLLRSVGPVGLRTPHTGALRYDPEQPKIPAAGIPVEDAERLRRLVGRGLDVRLRLKMEARFLPEAQSANLLAEVRGRERPEEVVVIGAHSDSWDVGTGAMDDGGGCVMVWEAARLIRALGLKPRRTVRVVLFTNEENGLRGGLAYRDAHQREPHVLAFEADSGAFKPLGFGYTGPESGRAVLAGVARLLAPLGPLVVEGEGRGADTGPVIEATGAPAASLRVDGERYFIYHHTPADTLDRLRREDVADGAAAIAALAYVVADLPARLGQ